MNFILDKMMRDARDPLVPGKSPLFMLPIRIEPQDDPLPEDLSEIRGVLYKRTDDAVLYLETTFPKRHPSGGKLPVAVYFHGGGLTMGSCSMCPAFRRRLAHLGYLVYSVDYRLLDKADAGGMFADACDALAFIRKDMTQYGGDPDQVFVLGESAGAFVSRIAVASAGSETLRACFGLTDFGLTIRGIVFFSGMFYTTARDPIGLVYRSDLFGKHLNDKAYMECADPDHPQILALLPPVFLTTSKGDFLRSYTLRFAKALQKIGHPFELIDYADRKDLLHAFPPLMPSLPESAVVMGKMHRWMKQLIKESEV